ncbi:MAG: hypothetical protein ACJA2W_000473 [Planctomycetota bacterium]|jgi:hypothetical protein
MIEPEDLWLEHGLREVLGKGSESGVDLSVRVREAWERGERRLAPRLVRTVSPAHPPSVVPQAVPRLRRVAAAAVMLGLAAGAYGWWVKSAGSTTEERGEPVAKAAPGVQAEVQAPLGPEIEVEAIQRDPTPSELAFLASVQELGSGDPRPGPRMENLRREFQSGVMARLRQEPELWTIAGPAVAELLVPGRVPGYVAEWLLSSLGSDPSPGALALLREAWLESPGQFSLELIVAMAERGAFESIREVERYFAVMGGEASSDSLPVAAYLALRGNDAGLAVLRQRFSGVQIPKNAALAAEGQGAGVLAAAGLEALGDVDAMSSLIEGYAPLIGAWIDDGNMEAARVTLDWLNYGVELLRSGGAVAFAGQWLRLRRDEAAVAGEAPTDTPELLRGELDALRAR